MTIIAFALLSPARAAPVVAADKPDSPGPKSLI
ncbi:MAG: hypothetical protein JWO81_900 [Alphaproteobacteria bacterium]|nr:hypothetical protein [Alphaproteobacteria bacterium]